MINEFTMKSPNNTLDHLCRELIRTYQGHGSGVYIYGDATSKKADVKQQKGQNFFTLILDNLKQFNPILRVPSANPSVVMRGNFINTVFEKNIYGLSIKIDSKCIVMINDLTNVKEAPDGTINKEMETNPETKVRYQKNGHFSDLFSYLICECFKNNYVTYTRGGAIGSPLFGFRENNSY